MSAAATPCEPSPAPALQSSPPASPPTPTSKQRNLKRLGAALVFYLGSLLLAEHLIEDRVLTGPPPAFAAALIAALSGLAFAGFFWILAALIIEEKDESLRLLYARYLTS